MKKTLRKLLAITLVTVLFGLTLVACGLGGGNDTGDETPPSSDTTPTPPPSSDVEDVETPNKTYYDILLAEFENGSVTADKTSAEAGEVVTLTVTPNEGYKLTALYLNGEVLEGTSFTMPEGNAVVTAEFEKIIVYYDVTVSQEDNGSVSADKTSAEAGEVVTLTVTPNEGYKLTALYLNGEALEGTSFTMPEGNVTITTAFEKIVYTITVTQPENGTVYANKADATFGETVILSASAAVAYKIDYYTVNGEKIEGNSFTMPIGNVVVSAHFAEIFAKGENIGYVNGIISTGGVDVSLDKGENPTAKINGGGEQYAYFNDVYGQKFYHEIKVNVENIVNNEAYPKFGILLQGEDFRVAFYVEMATNLTASAVGRVCFKNGVYDWSEASLVSVGALEFTGDNYVTLAVARDGADVYLYVNGKLVICEKGVALLDGKDTAVGQFTFNTTVNMKDYFVLNGDDASAKIDQAKADYMKKQGENYGSSGNYSSSVGVDMTYDRGDAPYVLFDGTASPQWAYLKDTSVDQIYYQADFNIAAVHNGDSYPKFGMFAQTLHTSMYFFVDMTPNLTATQVGVVYVRDGAWDWNNARFVKVSDMLFSGEDKIQLAVMRDGDDLVFLVNGKFALMVPSSELEGEASAFGAFSFNTELTVSGTEVYFSDAKVEEIRRLIPRVGPSANGVSYCLGDYIYDYDTDTITLLHANSTTRSIATLYEDGLPILTNRYSVRGTLRIYNTKTSGSAASKVELQVGVSTTNFFKFLIYRFGTTNNSVYIEGANQQGGGNITLTKVCNNTLPGGTDWTVDFEVIFDYGTIYLILDGEVQYIYETGWAQAGYSFGVLQYADTVWSNYEVDFDDAVADRVALYKDAYLDYKNAESALDEITLVNGQNKELASGSNYRAGANLVITDKISGASTSAYIKNENGTLVEYRLSVGSNGKWMIERICDGKTEVIVAPENKTYGWMDFSLAMNDTQAIFTLNGRVYDVVYGDFSNTTVSVGAANCSVNVHNSFAQQFADSDEAQTYIDAVPVYTFYSSYTSRANNLYKEYITEGNSEKGGVLILGSSTMDFWDTWATDMSLVDKITGYNVGIGGTTSEDWLVFYDKLIAPFDPSCVMIFVGGNDINVNGARGIDTAHRIEKLIEKIHTDFPEATIYYIYSLPTPNTYANGDFAKAEFKVLVDTLKAYCNSTDFVTGIDVSPVLTKDGNPIRELYKSDLIHLTPEGYALWTEYLLEHVTFPENLGKWYVESELENFDSQYVPYGEKVEIDFSGTSYAGVEGLSVFVTDEDGNNVAVTRVGDVFSFVMPIANVKVTYLVSEKYTNVIWADDGVLLKGVFTSKSLKKETGLVVPEHYASQSLAECMPEVLMNNVYIFGYAVSSDGGVSFGNIITDPGQVILNDGDILKVCFAMMGTGASGNSVFMNSITPDALNNTLTLGELSDGTRYWGAMYQNGEIYSGNNYTFSMRVTMDKLADQNAVLEVQVSAMPATDTYIGQKTYFRWEKNSTLLKHQKTNTITNGYNYTWAKTNTGITVPSTTTTSLTLDIVVVVTPTGYTLTATNVADPTQVYTETYVHTNTTYKWENINICIADVQRTILTVSDVKFVEND